MTQPSAVIPTQCQIPPMSSSDPTQSSGQPQPAPTANNTIPRDICQPPTPTADTATYTAIGPLPAVPDSESVCDEQPTLAPEAASVKVKVDRYAAVCCTNGWYFGLVLKEKPLRVTVHSYTSPFSNKVKEHRWPQTTQLPLSGCHVVSAHIIADAPRQGTIWKGSASPSNVPIRRGHQQAVEKVKATPTLEAKNEAALDEEIAHLERSPAPPAPAPIGSSFNIYMPDDDDIVESFPVSAQCPPDQILADLTKIWSHESTVQHFQNAHQGST